MFIRILNNAIEDLDSVVKDIEVIGEEREELFFRSC